MYDEGEQENAKKGERDLVLTGDEGQGQTKRERGIQKWEDVNIQGNVER